VTPSARTATAATAPRGKAVFASAGCGSCHTFKDAGATGTVGPNLDAAHPSVALAIDRVTNGKDGMPSFKGQLSKAQIRSVARYVAKQK
jgi:cytochrome c6